MPSVQQSLSPKVYDNLKAGAYHLENRSFFGERKIKFDEVETEYNMSTLFKELVIEEPTPDNLEKLKLFKQIDAKTSNFLVDIYYKIFGGRRKEVDVVKQHALEKLDVEIKNLRVEKSGNNIKITQIDYELASLYEEKARGHNANQDATEITREIKDLEKQLNDLRASNRKISAKESELKDLAINYKTIE